MQQFFRNKELEHYLAHGKIAEKKRNGEGRFPRELLILQRTNHTGTSSALQILTPYTLFLIV